MPKNYFEAFMENGSNIFDMSVFILHWHGKFLMVVLVICGTQTSLNWLIQQVMGLFKGLYSTNYWLYCPTFNSFDTMNLSFSFRESNKDTESVVSFGFQQ